MNPFNQLNGLDYIDADAHYRDAEMAGLFSKIKKGLSKLNDARKKVTKKVVGKKIYNLGTKIASNPIVKGVAAIAATTFLAPAAGALLKGAGIAGAKAAGTAAVKSVATKAGLVKLAGKAAVKNVAIKAATSPIKAAYTTAKIVAPAIKAAAPAVVSAAAKEAAARKLQAAQLAAQKEQEAKAVQLIKDAEAKIMPMYQTLLNDPKFKAIADSMLKAGASPRQIVEMWQQSEPAREIATAAAAQAVYDPVKQAYINQGISPQQAAVYAQDTAMDVAEDAVKKSTGGNLATIAAIGVPLLLALMGG